jgi:nucleotide-binding universal stress UspA family protein
MFQKVLIATDLSPYSDQVVDCAGRLHTLGCEEAILFHVEEARFSVGLAQALAEAHGPELEAQAERLRVQGIPVSAELAEGMPWHEICEAARRFEPDLVVLGSHGRGALSATVLGGTASRVVEHAPSPVLLLRMSLLNREERAQSPLVCERAPEHVLFPTDFSPASAKAFEALRALAPRVGTITLLHINERTAWEHAAPEVSTADEEEDRRRLQALAEILAESGCSEVRTELTQGRAKALVVDRTEPPVTLVVMGTAGWGAVPGSSLGGVSRAVARRGKAPVLLVRA